ncbi:MAG: IgGFc-binding protein [Polyangiales bacterium]
MITLAHVRSGLATLSFTALAACSAGGDKAAPAELGEKTDAGSEADVEPEAGIGIDGDLPEGGVVVGDPQTCAEAAAGKAYIGCDFWPTVVANNVWSIFDYAVVVANAGETDADIEVTGNGVTKKAKVLAHSLTKVYLPWNKALKGPDTDNCGTATPLPGTVRANKGAYHLVASRPVTVYQFNALEYKGEGGESGKSWAACPGNDKCDLYGISVGCFSFSNDASLLLPSTAMTGNYRVTGIHGWTAKETGAPVLGAYFTITATRDDTHVTVKVGPYGDVLAGGGVPATNAGGTITLSMNAGDAVELVGDARTTSDLSGSLVTADKPVQVIAGVPCIQQPLGVPACDHIEESVFPAETLGKDYIVSVPTGPLGNVVGHVVRIYGNRDGTKLVYAPKKPDGAPDTIDAGEVVELPSAVSFDFRITGDHEFAVGSFMLGGAQLDPGTPSPGQKGDPSMSLSTAIEQYRKKYVFLAPDDYDVSYVDIVHPDGASMTLDGFGVPAGKAIGTTGFNLVRVKLGAGKAGAHEIRATKPVGIQVMGYGSYTSYQYPGGLDLQSIAPPPVK